MIYEQLVKMLEDMETNKMGREVDEFLECEMYKLEIEEIADRAMLDDPLS